MSDIRYCKRCNSVFIYKDVNICPLCIKKYDEIMDKTKEFLYEHPLAGIVEIADGIEEKERDILYLLRTGRLILTTGAESLLCSRCGKKIENGKYCKECAADIRMQLNGGAQTLIKNIVQNENKEEGDDTSNGRMHTIYRHI